MTRTDFVDFGITYFTPEEVIATGAALEDVQPRTMQHLNSFRRELSQPVYLVKNGMTSGKHSSELHPGGLAVDCFAKRIEPNRIVKCAMNAMFKGIGLYWRDRWVSFHLDLRDECSLWLGYKRRSGQQKRFPRKWAYRSLILMGVDIPKVI